MHSYYECFMDTVFTTICHTFYGFHFSTLEITKKCAIYGTKRLIKFQNFEKMTTDEKNIFFMCLLGAHTLYSKNLIVFQCWQVKTTKRYIFSKLYFLVKKCCKYSGKPKPKFFLEFFWKIWKNMRLWDKNIILNTLTCV